MKHEQDTFEMHVPDHRFDDFGPNDESDLPLLDMAEFEATYSSDHPPVGETPNEIEKIVAQEGIEIDEEPDDLFGDRA